MSQFKLDVIVPTWNNPELLTYMINSMINIGFFKNGDKRLIVVNNGKQPIANDYAHVLATRNMMVINCEENLGWEGGLVKGLKYSDAKYVCFQNDDVHIPQSQSRFYEDLMDGLKDDIGLVGPTTTMAAGVQSVFKPHTVLSDTEVKWIIFFCAMTKRSILDEVGGVDDTLPGGDDFDLSIRMRKAGNKIMVIPKAFLIHHGFQTGERVNGNADKEGGWNSQSMSTRTNKGLIQKHGFRTFFETLSCQVVI